jgi:hypothetical protein
VFVSLVSLLLDMSLHIDVKYLVITFVDTKGLKRAAGIKRRMVIKHAVHVACVDSDVFNTHLTRSYDCCVFLRL